jgi:3-isopropylmalate dehydrogenase
MNQDDRTTRPTRLGYLLGDGIGPEIVPATRLVVDAALEQVGLPEADWVELPMGASALAEYDTPMPDFVKDELATCDGWLMGPHDSASYPERWHQRRERPASGELRHHFDLFLNARPNRNRAGVPAVVNDVDLMIVRENSEGFYADRNMFAGSGEFMPTPDTVLVVGVFTRSAAKRIAVEAFELARRRRGRVSIVHKSNVIPLAFGLFVDECLKVATGYPDVEVDDYLFDAMTAHLVRRPQAFDVIVTENMFGDTLSDLAGELVGGLGMAASLNASATHAMAQAAHGAAPDIAGGGIANPTGLIQSAAMLLDWLATRTRDDRLAVAGRLIDRGLDLAIVRGVRTVDLGGDAGTSKFAEAVASAVRSAG